MKNILLLVSGSISAYKSYDLVRLLIKKNYQVKVVLTKGALSFVNPKVFLYLGCEEVFNSKDDFRPRRKNVLHVELCHWADLALISPLSAGCLSRLASSSANDLISTLFLAWQKHKPFLFAPAMNSEMWSHPFTQENIKKVISLDWVGLIPPATGLLACGDVGPGKLPDVSYLAELVECYHPSKKKNQVVTITTGATVAPIDAVRYVTNPSTGLTGFEIAKSYLREGYRVELIVGHQPHPLIQALSFHPQCQIHYTSTTEEMKTKALALFPLSDIYISAAAVADIEFEVQTHKIKKSDLKELKIKGAVDILAEILKIKKSHQRVISFGAETALTEDVFFEKIKRKPVDLMVGNAVHNGLIQDQTLKGFATTEGLYYFVRPDSVSEPRQLSKSELANFLVQFTQTGELHG
jgi:phosphopantothenoylcysteine decarboxylase/phosphopantothenate--cysteine ligase